MSANDEEVLRGDRTDLAEVAAMPAEDLDDGLPFLRFQHKDNCWYLNKTKLWSQPLFLHQLQNLVYALSNEELNIQLGHFENAAMIGPTDFFVRPRQNIKMRQLM